MVSSQWGYRGSGHFNVFAGMQGWVVRKFLSWLAFRAPPLLCRVPLSKHLEDWPLERQRLEVWVSEDWRYSIVPQWTNGCCVMLFKERLWRKIINLGDGKKIRKFGRISTIGQSFRYKNGKTKFWRPDGWGGSV